jgi:hypothetical protein
MANAIKLFLSVIYRFSYLARVFVIIDWKSFPMTNTLAVITKIRNLQTKKFFNIGPTKFDIKERELMQGILKGEVSLYH